MCNWVRVICVAFQQPIYEVTCRSTRSLSPGISASADPAIKCSPPTSLRFERSTSLIGEAFEPAIGQPNTEGTAFTQP